MKAAAFCACIFLAGCSRSNNLLLGTVRANVGTHEIEVTDCYRTSVPPPQTLGPDNYRFVPCRDAAIEIKSGELTVNGTGYGHIKPTDAILVDHGKVSVHAAGTL
jgi:hypothetical protein